METKGNSRKPTPAIPSYEVNHRETPVALATAFDELIDPLAERNFDLHEAVGDGRISGPTSRDVCVATHRLPGNV